MDKSFLVRKFWHILLIIKSTLLVLTSIANMQGILCKNTNKRVLVRKLQKLLEELNKMSVQYNVYVYIVQNSHNIELHKYLEKKNNIFFIISYFLHSAL